MTTTPISVAAETADDVTAVLLDPTRPRRIVRHEGRAGVTVDQRTAALADELLGPRGRTRRAAGAVTTTSRISMVVETADDNTAVQLGLTRPCWIVCHGGRVGVTPDKRTAEQLLDLPVGRGERRERR
ncbi:hypothetical protein [Nocardia sp. Marseille-Q1738]